jgi:hypothetical protein
MTTIATDGKSMAGDSQTTAGREITGYASKVTKLEDGRIIGACGPSVDCIKFRIYMAEGGDKPSLTDDFCALLLKPNGAVSYLEKDMIEIPYRVPAGVGSGSEFAIGAMMAGKSPADAVALAIDRDTNSGGASRDGRGCRGNGRDDMSLIGDAEAVATGGPVALALKHWKLIVGVVGLLGVLIYIVVLRGEVRHWQKQDALHVSQRDVEIQKNGINLASIDTLSKALAAKNAESEARAKAYADAKAADARTVADLDRRYSSTAARVAALQAIARVPGGNEACRVPTAVAGALEGL